MENVTGKYYLLVLSRLEHLLSQVLEYQTFPFQVV